MAAALGVFLLGTVLLLVAAVVIGRLMGISPRGAGFAQALAIVIELAFLGSAVLFSVVKYHVGWQSLGFRRFPMRRLYLPFAGAVGGFGILVAYRVAIARIHLGFLHPVSNLPAHVSSYSPGLLLLLFLSTVIAAPLAEETFFRGFLFAGLMRALRPLERWSAGRISTVAVAALLSGTIFAAFHLQAGLLIPFTAFGALLAWIYRRGDSLWLNILTHATYNLVVVVVAVVAAGGLGHRVATPPVGGRPQTAGVSQSTSTALAPPFEEVSVIPGRGVSAARADQARADLHEIAAQMSQDYGVTTHDPFRVYLANDEETARQVLTDAGVSATGSNSFFTGNYSVDSLAGSNGALVYLPKTGNDLRGPLAIVFSDYTLRELGGGRPNTFPYWFVRGFRYHEWTRFSQLGFTLRATAAADVRTGSAPSLAELAQQADASQFARTAQNGPARADARGQAAVDYIAVRHGEGAVGRLLNGDAFGSVARFNQVLQTVVGMTPDEFNDAVSDSLS